MRPWQSAAASASYAFPPKITRGISVRGWHSTVSAQLVVSLEHGQGIQTGAIFCNDGSSGVDRVWRDGVLHSSRGSRQNGGGAGRLCTRGKGGRGRADRDKIADGR